MFYPAFPELWRSSKFRVFHGYGVIVGWVAEKLQKGPIACLFFGLFKTSLSENCQITPNWWFLVFIVIVIPIHRNKQRFFGMIAREPPPKFNFIKRIY